MQENFNNVLRVGLYSRVSTEEQREGQTIDSQVGELERFAQDKTWVITRVYKDEGWSGSVLARPELDRLRDDASKRVFDIVLINDVDRLARDVTHLGIIKRDLERHGVRLVFRKLPNENSPTHNLLVNILGSFAEFERELIGDRTRRGKRYKVEVRKQYLGAIAPYGFRRMPRDRPTPGIAELEIFPEEALIVRRMYRWVDREGFSARKVVERLKQLGIPARRGKPWQKSSVLRILRSEVYAGVWHYNKHQHCEPKRATNTQKYRRILKSSSRLRPKTEWLPVKLAKRLRMITPGQWRRVQRQLDRNIAFSPRNSKHHYLLGGLVRCGGCSASYVGDPSHGRFAYRCLRRCGKIPSIREQFLNVTVWAAFEEALQNPDLILQGAKVSEQNLDSESTSSEHSEMARAQEQIRAEETRVLEAYRLAILTPEQLARELEVLKNRRKLLESRSIETPTAKIPEPLLKGRVREACGLVAQRLATLNFDGRQELLRRLLTKVIFEGNRVKLIGSLPLDRNKQPDNPNSSGRIATTASSDCDRRLREIPVDSRLVLAYF